ncbi:SpaA isopeptide-forming pilin-related protein [Bacillus licheniformis]|nr:SpaA isopeptide-forming pilin-related protein [Bacillus licheniformis]
MVSDRNGTVTASGLAPGRYAFVETKAPDGFVLNSGK